MKNLVSFRISLEFKSTNQLNKWQTVYKVSLPPELWEKQVIWESSVKGRIPAREATVGKRNILLRFSLGNSFSLFSKKVYVLCVAKIIWNTLYSDHQCILLKVIHKHMYLICVSFGTRMQTDAKRLTSEPSRGYKMSWRPLKFTPNAEKRKKN